MCAHLCTLKENGCWVVVVVVVVTGAKVRVSVRRCTGTELAPTQPHQKVMPNNFSLLFLGP